MNIEQEHQFIRAFVRRERRERAQFELRSAKKRGAFISRLCHRYHDILDDRYFQPLIPPNSDYHLIFHELKRHTVPEWCYCISARADLDGRSLPLAHALACAVGYGLPTIILVIPERLCYFEAEQEYGSPPRFILERS
jgi:hypothetical protein